MTDHVEKHLGVTFTVTQDAIDDGAARGIDVLAEIRNAIDHNLTEDEKQTLTKLANEQDNNDR